LHRRFRRTTYRFEPWATRSTTSIRLPTSRASQCSILGPGKTAVDLEACKVAQIGRLIFFHVA